MAGYRIVVKRGTRYHYYPKGRSGNGKPLYVRVQPRAAMQTGQGHAAGTPSPGAAPAPAAAVAPPPQVPLIDPFLRPEDLQSLADFQFAQANQLADIDRGMADLSTQTAYDRTQVDKSAKQGTSEATDNAIARGLFRSSVKDATLYDIEGQRVRSQQLYTDRLNNATMDADRRKAILRQAQDSLAERMRQQAVQNAREVSANQPVAAPTPAASAPASAGKPAPQKIQGRDSRGNPGVWHVYPNGRRVFVRKG